MARQPNKATPPAAPIVVAESNTEKKTSPEPQAETKMTPDTVNDAFAFFLKTKQMPRDAVQSHSVDENYQLRIVTGELLQRVPRDEQVKFARIMVDAWAKIVPTGMTCDVEVVGLDGKLILSDAAVGQNEIERTPQEARQMQEIADKRRRKLEAAAAEEASRRAAEEKRLAIEKAAKAKFDRIAGKAIAAIESHKAKDVKGIIDGDRLTITFIDDGKATTAKFLLFGEVPSFLRIEQDGRSVAANQRPPADDPLHGWHKLLAEFK